MPWVKLHNLKMMSRPDICHEYIRGEKIVMYDNCGAIENFSTCGEISVQLMWFYCNLCRFVAKFVNQADL